MISPADVQLIRKVIYAPGSAGGFTVTLEEAELIFDLNDATIAAENAPGWGDLFVKAIANHLIENDLYDRDFVRRWWNWEEYMVKERADEDATFEAFEGVLKRLYAEFTFEFAAQESGLAADVIALAFGWGDPSDDRDVREKGSNVQRLIPDDYRYDPVTGLALQTAVPVNVYTPAK